MTACVLHADSQYLEFYNSQQPYQTHHQGPLMRLALPLAFVQTA